MTGVTAAIVLAFANPPQATTLRPKFAAHYVPHRARSSDKIELLLAEYGRKSHESVAWEVEINWVPFRYLRASLLRMFDGLQFV